MWRDSAALKMFNWENRHTGQDLDEVHRKGVPFSHKCNILVGRDWRIGAAYFLLQQMQRRYTALHELENVLRQENHLQKDVLKQLEGHQVFHKVPDKPYNSYNSLDGTKKHTNLDRQ